MAGTYPGFSGAAFRDAIQFAMTMGTPSDAEKGITFRWTPLADYPIHDPATRPYDWTATADAVEEITDLQVLCAVQVNAAGTVAENAVGTFNETTIILTLLDEQYDQIVAHGDGRFPDLIEADEDTYVVRYIPPPNGLFDVTVWQVHCVARSEG